jgi:hypothetical protein
MSEGGNGDLYSTGMTGVSQLLTKWMDIEALKEIERKKRLKDLEMNSWQTLANTRTNTLEAAGQAGQREMSAIDRLLQALNGTRR